MQIFECGIVKKLIFTGVFLKNSIKKSEALGENVSDSERAIRLPY